MQLRLFLTVLLGSAGNSHDGRINFCDQVCGVLRAPRYDANSWAVSSSHALTSRGRVSSLVSRGAAPSRLETLAEMADKAIGSTESLCSVRCLAPAKCSESSFQMLVVPLDPLLLRFSCDVFDLREDGDQRGRIGGGFVGGHEVWRHSGVVQSGAEESRRHFGIALFPEEYLDDLSRFIDGSIHMSPASSHFHVRFIHGPTRPTRCRCTFAAS